MNMLNTKLDMIVRLLTLDREGFILYRMSASTWGRAYVFPPRINME